jgi:hypothetical protein
VVSTPDYRLAGRTAQIIITTFDEQQRQNG